MEASLSIALSKRADPLMYICLQTTSLFLHWFPACVAWTERWHPDVHVREYNKKSTEAMAEWHEATLLDLVVLPMIPYLTWALLYYVKVSKINCVGQCYANWRDSLPGPMDRVALQLKL